jgi:hypothetical protein
VNAQLWKLVEIVITSLALVTAAGAAMVQATGETTPVLACEVWGHDVILYNRGDRLVDAGTVVHWSAWLGKREGDHTLEADLEPFVGLYLISALGASYWDLRPCEAYVVQSPNAGM